MLAAGMRWLAKAALQKGISALPRAESVNYTFQRHVSRSLPVREAGFRRKFRGALRHLAAYEDHGPRGRAGAVVFYELGAGWDLALQLSYWSLGVERQVLCDVRPNLRLELVGVTLEHLRRLRPALERKTGRKLRDPGTAPVRSLEELEARFGIVYLAPRDARATGLDAGSVDFVSSTNTLEHVPADELVPILRECRRLLRADGVTSHRIDLHDHFADFDATLSPYNFLRHSDRTWALVNSKLMYQSRLRRPDYLDAFSAAGFLVVGEKARRPDEALAELRRLELAPRFRRYALDDLAVTALVLVARPAGRSPDAAQEPEDLFGRGSAGIRLRAAPDGGRLGDER